MLSVRWLSKWGRGLMVHEALLVYAGSAATRR
jgi:hypothetical protein